MGGLVAMGLLLPSDHVEQQVDPLSVLLRLVEFFAELEILPLS
jgi:hypothetical protein